MASTYKEKHTKLILRYTFKAMKHRSIQSIVHRSCLDSVYPTRLHIVDVARNRHIENQWVFPQQPNIVYYTLLQIAEGKERNVVGIFCQVLADLCPDVVV